MDAVKNQKHKLIELYKNPNAFKRHLKGQKQRCMRAVTNSKERKSSTRREPRNTRNNIIKEKKWKSIIEVQYKLEARYKYDLLLDKMFKNFAAPCKNQMENIKIPSHALKVKRHSSQYIGIGLKYSFIKSLENQIKVSNQNNEKHVSQMEITELDNKNTDDAVIFCHNLVSEKNTTRKKINDLARSYTNTSYILQLPHDSPVKIIENASVTPDDSLFKLNGMLPNFKNDINSAPPDSTHTNLIINSDSYYKGNTIGNYSNHAVVLLNDSTMMKRKKDFESVSLTGNVDINESASKLNVFSTKTNSIEIDSYSSTNGSVSDRKIILLDDNSFKTEIDSENDDIEYKLQSSMIQTNNAAHEIMESNALCLTGDQEEVVHSAIKGSRNDVLIKKFKIEILRSDIKRLCENEWLNDKIINFYMNLIVEHSGNSQMNLNTYALDSFLMSRYMAKGYDGVKRWTRKVDIFAYDIILIPINISNVHWVLGVINFKNKFIRYYDSMQWGHLTFNIAYLKEYLQSESLDKRRKVIDLNEFSISKPTNIPQQSNCIDCGVFICLFANLIRQNKELNFTQNDIPYYRKRMVYEILRGQLMQ